MEAKRIAVVGGVNVDITGTSFAPMIAGDSNPGHIRTTYGGVGRNIAENLRRLGWDVLFVSILGGDAAADGIRCHLKKLGIQLSGITLPEENCSTYLCLNGPDGNVAAAVADMDILDRLTPRALSPFLDDLNRCEAVVADANLPAESLSWLSETLSVPLFCDPVSVSKAPKLMGALHRLTALKPNRAEASVLTGQKVETREEIATAARKLREMGAEKVFISLGSDGVYSDDGQSSGFSACLPGPIVNTTGCGDAFFAAAVDGILRKFPREVYIRQGLAASALCAACEEGVCPELSRETLQIKMKAEL